MSYYSLEDVETDGLRVPVKFQVSTPGLGFLLEESGNSISKEPKPIKSEAVIPAGAETIIPLWLAVPLASASVDETSDDPFLNVGEPPSLNNDVINILRSDPASIDLRQQNRLFTNLTLYWCELFGSADLQNTLYDTVRLRASHILDAALAQNGVGGVDKGLDDYERRLYQESVRVIRDAQINRRR